jgi:hypothetical protein
MARWNELDLQKELASGPLKQNGFTNELKQRIADNIERKAGFTYKWTPLFSGLGFALVLLAAISQFQPGSDIRYSESRWEAAFGVSDPAAEVRELKTALLIGLRQDLDAGDGAEVLGGNSHYRTLLIAPEGRVLQKKAEGEGILMPYRQDFWKIDAYETADTGVQMEHLTIKPAEALLSNDASAIIGSAPAGIYSDKLLFAGNRYLSFMRVFPNESGPADQTRAWVSDLARYEKAKSRDLLDGAVQLEDIFGIRALEEEPADALEAAQQTDGPADAQWTIARTPGEWVARSMDEGGTQWMELEEPLPEEIVSHDRLCCTWENIREVQPAAADALSSPVGDIIALITPDRLYVHTLDPYDSSIDPMPLLSLELKPSEHLVMAQWATTKYVDKWIQEASQYLSGPKE